MRVFQSNNEDCQYPYNIYNICNADMDKAAEPDLSPAISAFLENFKDENELQQLQKTNKKNKEVDLV